MVQGPWVLFVGAAGNVPLALLQEEVWATDTCPVLAVCQ